MKIFLKIIILITFLFLGNFQLTAKHIIGGEITYVCNGDGQYDFIMRIYRDCVDDGACFDSDPSCAGNRVLDGHLTFFEGGKVLGTVNLGAPQITNIEPNLSNPCLIAPPNVCVEEGVYRFSAELPFNTDDITVSYQRCCRNNFITNIIRPDISGATYTTTLSPLSRDSCNSSPVFNGFPPIVICQGEDVDFDHSATDPDGDSLVYSFCTPFLGGGNISMGQGIFGPDGLAPNPETAPPYDPVRFVSGYRAVQPLNVSANRDEPAVSINAETGLISGFPSVLGQFVVGVCVKAYNKEGVMVNEVRRDFQFNVVGCRNSLVADVEETELREKNGEPLFYIKICGEGEIINESTTRSFIEELFWEFDVPGGKTTSDLWDPFDLEFPNSGIYDGFLILNPGFPKCTDTAQVQVDIFPQVRADFEFEYDTCLVEPVDFMNLSYSDAGPQAITNLIWEVDTFTTIDQEDISFQFPYSGRFDVTLTAIDSNECTESITKEVPFLPLPQTLVIAPSAADGCSPVLVNFAKPSPNVTEEYELIWDFGDGNFGEGISPTNIYENEGVFPVSLEVITPFGCVIDSSFGDLITVIPSPTADFFYSPGRISRLDPVVTFTDQSIDAIRWDWVFDGFFNSREQNPVYTYKDSGEKLVSLVVTAANGCQDTMFQLLEVIPDIVYKLPNAFSPNGDGTNDLFFGVGNADEAEAFEMTIWNRYGELIFETNDANVKWNGRKLNRGEDAPNGVYVVTVSYINYNGEVTNIKGFVTVLR